MTRLDVWAVALYLATVLGAALLFARRQRSTDDYYVAGRQLGSGWVALSMLATQVSAISLIGGPAFVALQAGGGLVWLQYELAVPLAMLAVMMVVAPVLRRGQFVTVYQYVGVRFGAPVRSGLALVFLLARGLATGVALYAVALPLAVVFNLPLMLAMLAIGGFAIVYTTIGGMQADVFSDVLQLIVLVGTVSVLVVEAAMGLGGWGPAFEAIPAERLRMLVWTRHGLGDGETFALWPMLVGGFFLYVSYYGADQTQAQRLLATLDVAGARRALLWTGLFRFPIAALYCLLGLLLAGWLAARPEFAALVAGERADALVPRFVVEHAPAGVRGLFIAGLLAAAMSTLDSAYNSLSAVTLRDLLGRREQDLRNLRAARGLTVLWGLLCTASSFLFARSSQTVIETVNQVGSLFYGPILALLALGMLSRRATTAAALGGLAAGLAANAALWMFAPGFSWMWWNAAGFGLSLGAGYGLAKFLKPWRPDPALLWRPLSGEVGAFRLRTALAPGALVLAFVAMLVVGLVLSRVP